MKQKIIIVCFLAAPAISSAKTDVDLIERIGLLEDQVELFQQTKTQDVFNAFDRSSFASEMIREMHYVSEEVAGARVEIGKGAATLKSLELSLKENQRRVNINTDGINHISNRLGELDIKIPIIERRVDTLEIKNDKRVESRRAAYLDVIALLVVAGISWVATIFYKKYRALKKGRRASDN